VCLLEKRQKRENVERRKTKKEKRKRRRRATTSLLIFDEQQQRQQHQQQRSLLDQNSIFFSLLFFPFPVFCSFFLFLFRTQAAAPFASNAGPQQQRPGLGRLRRAGGKVAFVFFKGFSRGKSASPALVCSRLRLRRAPGL